MTDQATTKGKAGFYRCPSCTAEYMTQRMLEVHWLQSKACMCRVAGLFLCHEGLHPELRRVLGLAEQGAGE